MIAMNIKDYLDWRGLTEENACPNCGGSGVYSYSNTATYHHYGVAGQGFTLDVCNKCWGSGNRYEPWPNRLHLERAFASINAAFKQE